MVAQPIEMLIVFVLIFTSFILPILVSGYYTPSKPARWVKLPVYLRYKNDYYSGRIFVKRLRAIWISGVIVVTFFLIVFGGGCQGIKHRHCPASCEYDVYERALKHGISPGLDGECPAYSEMGDDGRCYPI